jgi:hypothetical protein
VAVLPQLLQTDDALQRVVGYARRHGEAHALLAMHAALPLGLTPDLLHLVRINFASSAPWIAEADLLLSPLCREVGGDLYEMVPDVRELLLDELRSDAEFGPTRIREVAEFLVEYSVRLLKGSSEGEQSEMRDFLKAQEWVGLAYARPEEAANSLALALREELEANDTAEVVRIAGLTEALTAPLLSEEKLLIYSVAVKHLATGEAQKARSFFETLGPLDQPTTIGGIELPAPSSLMPAAVVDVTEKESATQVTEPAVVEPVVPETEPKTHTYPSRGLSEKDWEYLLRQIQKGKCTPLVGAGASYGTLPLASDIASQWARQYDYPFNDPHDLARVSQFVTVTTDPSYPKQQMVDLLSQVDPPNFNDPNSIHGTLAELPLPVYLTLSYDDFMLKALRQRDKDVKVDVCRWNKYVQPEESSLDYFQPTVANPLVFHLYGTSEQPESLVLTTDDYLDLIFNVARDQRLFPPRIQQALTSTVLLFIGTAFADINLQVLLQVISSFKQMSLMRQGFIQLVPPTGSNGREERVRNYLQAYFEKQDIRIYWGTAQQFSDELKERWMEFSKGL